MPACEKCWADSAHERMFGDRDDEGPSAYHRVLRSRDDRPCYLECPNDPPHPDHYAYFGCPACGFKFGVDQSGEGES